MPWSWGSPIDSTTDFCELEFQRAFWQKWNEKYQAGWEAQLGRPLTADEHLELPPLPVKGSRGASAGGIINPGTFININRARYHKTEIRRVDTTVHVAMYVPETMPVPTWPPEVGRDVIIEGADQGEYNGRHTITAVSTSESDWPGPPPFGGLWFYHHCMFETGATPATPATGTMIKAFFANAPWPIIDMQEYMGNGYVDPASTETPKEGWHLGLAGITGEGDDEQRPWRRKKPRTILTTTTKTDEDGNTAVVGQRAFLGKATFRTGAKIGTGPGVMECIAVSSTAATWQATYAELALTSLTRSGSTATATRTNHHYQIGDIVTIRKAVQSGYNGTFTVTAKTTDTFSFELTASPLPATPATPITGFSITVQRVQEVTVDVLDSDQPAPFRCKAGRARTGDIMGVWLWQQIAAAFDSQTTLHPG